MRAGDGTAKFLFLALILALAWPVLASEIGIGFSVVPTRLSAAYTRHDSGGQVDRNLEVGPSGGGTPVHFSTRFDMSDAVDIAASLARDTMTASGMARVRVKLGPFSPFVPIPAGMGVSRTSAQLAVLYRFPVAERAMLATGAGLYLVDLQAGASAGSDSISGRLFGGLPFLGASLVANNGAGWSWGVSVQGGSLDTPRTTANWQRLSATLRYTLSRHWAMEGEYRSDNLKIVSHGTRWVADVSLPAEGFFLTLFRLF